MAVDPNRYPETGGMHVALPPNLFARPMLWRLHGEQGAAPIIDPTIPEAEILPNGEPGVYDVGGEQLLRGLTPDAIDELQTLSPGRVIYAMPVIPTDADSLVWANFDTGQIVIDPAAAYQYYRPGDPRSHQVFRHFVLPALNSAVASTMPEPYPSVYVRSTVVSVNGPISYPYGMLGSEVLRQRVGDVPSIFRTGYSFGTPYSSPRLFSRETLRYNEPPRTLHPTTQRDLLRHTRQVQEVLRTAPDALQVIHPALVVYDPRKFRGYDAFDEQNEYLLSGPGQMRWEDAVLAVIIAPAPALERAASDYRVA